MQIGPISSSSLNPATAEGSSASEDFKAATAFANVLASSFSGQAKDRLELKGPEAAERPRAVERTEARPEPRNETRPEAKQEARAENRPEPRDTADSKPKAAEAGPKDKVKDAPKAPAQQAQETKASDDSAAETAAPAESQAAEATDKTGETPEGEAQAKTEEAVTVVADAIDPALLLNMYIPAAQAAVPAEQAGAASQNGTQNGAQAGVAVDGKVKAEMSAEDAALQQIQASVLSPEAQAQVTDAARQPQQKPGTQDGQANAGKLKGKIEIQASVEGAAPKPLVDPAALFAEMMAQGMDMDAELATGGEVMPGAEQHAAKLENQMLAANPFAVALDQAASAESFEAAKSGVTGMAAVGSTQAQPQALAAAQAQAAQAPRNPAALVPPGEQVAVQIKKAASEGIDTISIKLDPGNLGKVEVTLEVSHDGRLLAVIAADKPETLQMLQKDAGSLEQSLRDGGLKTSNDSLSFQLRDQSQDGRGFAGNESGRRGYGRGGDEYGDAGAMGGDARAMAAAADAQRAAARGGLDIRI